jgi:hypothetical protein
MKYFVMKQLLFLLFRQILFIFIQMHYKRVKYWVRLPANNTKNFWSII